MTLTIYKIQNCKFNDNANAITVKDQTTIYAWDNQFTNNKNDYSSYIKKKIFISPTLYLMQDAKQNIISGEIITLTSENKKNQKDIFNTEFEKFNSNYSIFNKLKLDKLIE